MKKAICVGVALLVSAASLVRAAIPLPDEKQHVISLDGQWRFKLEQAPKPPRFLSQLGKPIPIKYPATFESFYSADYREDTNWHNITVPGNWEMAGFSPATYNQPDNASGFYRTYFQVPKEWVGRVVKINFDGVQNGCEIWCNGQPVAVDEGSWGRMNYHESGWTAWQADLTPVVRFGESNLLALRVTKNTKSVNCDTGDFFFLGGVHRPVTLFSVPQNHVHDIFIETKLLPNDRAEVSVQLAGEMKGCKVSMLLEGQTPVEGEVDAAGKVKLAQIVSKPRLWSAEFPDLYALSVDLKDSSGKVIQHLSRRVGIREVSIKDGVFQVNHVPVKLVGICRHDVHPTLGTAINEEVWKKDLTLMKAANFNAVRTSHYPYGSKFYDLCDEMGFYVLGESPLCWVDTKDAELEAAFAQRTREAVTRDKNHPSIVLWGIGNENKPGPNNALAARITREIDPTRPRLISCQKGDDGTEPVEFDDKHYITPERMREAELDPRRAKWPMIYSENPNVWDVRNGPDYGSLDLWGLVMDRTMRELRRDDHVCGTFLWEWQDRAVADKSPTKYYFYYPKTGIHLVKPKGIVDGFRNPRPEYYHVKMAQTPIVLGNEFTVKGDTVVLQATNYYSFTDLEKLHAHWTLSRASKNLKEGETKLKLAPRSHGALSVSLPAGELAEADTLRLDLDHPGGWNVVTYQFPLKPVSHTAPTVRMMDGLMFPQFNLMTAKQVRDEEGKGWRRLIRSNGHLANVKVQKTDGTTTSMDEAKLLATPFASVKSIEADVVLQPGNKPVGRLSAGMTNGAMDYHFVWAGDKSDIYELGWIFQGSKGVDRFSWDRKAPWSYYPSTHIGRATGTAMPDSADCDITRVDRPDAFDFNSTKFDCNWASLTDADGRGLCIAFAPEQRQHVRGAINDNRTYGLVINRCYTPPRDISNRIVAEYYTVFEKDTAISGRFEVRGVAMP